MIEENKKIRFCINCGSPLGENAKFCVSCGWKVQLPEINTPEPETKPAQEPAVPAEPVVNVDEEPKAPKTALLDGKAPTETGKDIDAEENKTGTKNSDNDISEQRERVTEKSSEEFVVDDGITFETKIKMRKGGKEGDGLCL